MPVIEYVHRDIGIKMVALGCWLMYRIYDAPQANHYQLMV